MIYKFSTIYPAEVIVKWNAFRNLYGDCTLYANWPIGKSKRGDVFMDMVVDEILSNGKFVMHPAYEVDETVHLAIDGRNINFTIEIEKNE